MAPIDWSVAVFARNEEQSISKCLKELDKACVPARSICTVIVNGSTDRTRDLSVYYSHNSRMVVKVFEIRYGDKSNAWNEFVYRVRPEAQVYLFVDAYVWVNSESLSRLAAAFELSRPLNAATGVPTRGRSAVKIADAMLRFGGLHGSLHALPRHFVSRIVDKGYRLPIGLYRGDGLIGSMAMHDLDAVGQPWRPDLVAVVPEATWEQRPLSNFRPPDLRRQYNRMVQQARGRLENAAIKSIIYRSGYSALPEFADDMIKQWLAQIPDAERRRYFRDPLARLALSRMRREPRPRPGELVARSTSNVARRSA